MTLSEEFISYEEDGVVAPTYPTAFGITFTPQILGILFAVLGLVGGAYLLVSLVLPAWQRYQELTNTQNQKQALLQQKAANLPQKQQLETELVRANQQKKEVLALFANEQTLDTLLLDLNRLVQSTNTGRNTNAKLTKFVPANQSAEVIADGSLGSQVNGKLKQRTVDITFEGTFEQTQSILRNIERLQPLMIVKSYQSTMATPSNNEKDKSVGGSPTISTSFKLQALIPVSAEEAAQFTQSQQQKK